MTDGIITQPYALVKRRVPHSTPVSYRSTRRLRVRYSLFGGQCSERGGVIRALGVIVPPCPET